MKSHKGRWGESLNFDMDDETLQDTLGLDGQDGEGIVFLEEAHEALLKLSQKTSKRSKVQKHTRRADSWL